MTPFVAVPEPSESAAADLAALVDPGERIGILGVIPELGPGWRLTKEIEIHQYVWPQGREVGADDHEDMRKLTESDIPAMLDLSALVYPAYFRADTARLGDYYGIMQGGNLAAMAGIRMSMDGHQELSAICTHPDHRGKGYAALLTRRLLRQVQEQGEVAFLHTESYNSAAKALYEKLGFELARIMPFRVLDRL